MRNYLLLLGFFTFFVVGCPEPIPETYTITFDSNGGTGTMKSQTFTAEVEQNLTANSFTKDYCLFAGWSEKKEDTKASYDDNAKFVATKNTTLYAVWIDKRLTFTSKKSTTLTIKYTGDKITVPKDMQYSKDGEEWIYFTKENSPIEFEGDLYLRGKSSFGTAISNSDYLSFQFGDGAEVIAKGDIRNLVDYTNITKVNTNEARFCALFEGCTGLLEAPELGATQLEENCYYNMFKGCTSLKKAPSLPAKKMALFCYQAMFSGCSNLTQAPILPADELATSCYSNMFEECIELTNAPALNASKLVASCYFSMFKNCKQLKAVTMLGRGEIPSTALQEWLSGTAAEGTGTLTVAKGESENSTINKNLPENWTIEKPN